MSIGPIGKPLFGHTGVSREFVAPPITPPKQTDLLDQEFPDAHARLLDEGVFSQMLPEPSEALATLGKVLPHKPVKDPEISSLETNLKLGSSFLIASLATWGLRQRILGVGEFLGFLSWFGAMAFTPKIINMFTQLKTGANLNRMYTSTYGERKNLFSDPNYLPLHLVPDSEMESVANRLKIPSGPDRRRKTEEKLRQISVQSRTLWMLVAGPATPVLSGLICDLLQEPITRGITALRFKRGIRLAQKGMEQSSAKLAQRVEKNVDRVIGKRPDSMLAAWWKDFGSGLLQRTGLRDAFHLKEAVDGSPELQLKKMVEHFTKLQGEPERLDTVERYLNWQSDQLKRLETMAFRAFDPFEKRLPTETAENQYRFIRQRINNARNTIAHYRVLVDALRAGGQSPEEIHILVEKPLLSDVQRLMEDGYYTEAQRLAGSPDNYNKISKHIGRRQFMHAYTEMGASIDSHMREALRAEGLRSLWRRRMPIGLGGGLLMATAVYTALFVGRDFKTKGGTA